MRGIRWWYRHGGLVSMCIVLMALFCFLLGLPIPVVVLLAVLGMAHLVWWVSRTS